MAKERIHIVISVEKEQESKLIVDLLKSSGWEVKYSCTEQEKPEFITTELIRKDI